MGSRFKNRGVGSIKAEEAVLNRALRARSTVSTSVAFAMAQGIDWPTRTVVSHQKRRATLQKARRHVSVAETACLVSVCLRASCSTESGCWSGTTRSRRVRACSSLSLFKMSQSNPSGRRRLRA